MTAVGEGGLPRPDRFGDDAALVERQLRTRTGVVQGAIEADQAPRAQLSAANEKDADARRFAAGPADQRIEDLGERARSIDRAHGFDQPFACGTLSGPRLGTGIAATLLTPLREPVLALSTRDAASVFGSGDRIGQAIGGLLFGGGNRVRQATGGLLFGGGDRIRQATGGLLFDGGDRVRQATGGLLFGGGDGVVQAGRGGALGRGSRFRQAGGDGLFGRGAGAGRSL